MIYLISGKRFSGKNYFSELLLNYYKSQNINYIITSFAERAKIEFCKINNINYKTFNLRINKEKYRKKLIEYAENKKKENKYYWCIKLFEKYKNINNIIISDCRFIEEIEYLKINKIKFVTVRIKSDKKDKKKRGLVLSDIDNHVSENNLDNYKFDKIIINNGKIKIDKFFNNK